MSERTKDSNRKSNYEENNQFNAAIRELQISMRFLGIWPRTCSEDRCNLVWYVQSLGIAFIWFGVAAGLIVNIDDTDAVIDSLSLLIPITFYCLKWITFAIQRELINELIYHMNKDWTDSEEITLIGQNVRNCKQIMTRYSRIPRIFFITSVTVLTSCVVFYVRDSLSSRNSTDKFLPTQNGWYPLDYDQGFNFELLVAAQTVTLTTVTLFGVSVDSFFCTATLHLCGQFRILRYFMESISYDTITPEHCKVKIKLVVRRHQVLLGVAETIQKAFNHIILIQLSTATLSVCFLGYAFLSETMTDLIKPIALLKTGLGCGGTLLLIFSYCIVGDILTNQSAAIVMAVYNTRWYDCTKSTNLSFSLVMIRAGKPLQLTGAKLLPMSLESFVVILKMAVSYLSVLRAVNGK